MDKCAQRVIRETVGQHPMPLYRAIANEAGAISTLSNGFMFGRVGIPDAKKFIEKYEWLGYMGRGRICLGMWKNDALYGVEVFSPLPILAARSLPEALGDRSLFLSRGACCLDAGEHAASMLLGASLRYLKNKGYLLIVAYADEAAGETGVIYKATNAVYAGTTTSRGTTYALIDGRWYSPKSLYNRFSVSKVSQLPTWVKVETTKEDTTNKLRFIWVLHDRKRTMPMLPKSWGIL